MAETMIMWYWACLHESFLHVVSWASTWHTSPSYLNKPELKLGCIVSLAYSAYLHTSSQHDYGLNPVLPYHPPEMDDCLPHWTCNHTCINISIPYIWKYVSTLCCNIIVPTIALEVNDIERTNDYTKSQLLAGIYCIHNLSKHIYRLTVMKEALM